MSWRHTPLYKWTRFVVVPSAICVGLGWFTLRLMPTPKSKEELKEESPENFTKTRKEFFQSEDYKWRKEISSMVNQMQKGETNVYDYLDNYVARKKAAEKEKREVFRRLIKEGKTSEEEVIAEFKKINNPDTVDIDNTEYLEEIRQHQEEKEQTESNT